MEFLKEDLKKLSVGAGLSKGSHGQVTVIGGSRLFHGAPLFSLVAASRVVDMVFFASPEGSLGEVASQMKARLGSFIWVPWEELGSYITKSDAVLIGPGFMSRKAEEGPDGQDETYKLTKMTTELLLSRFAEKKWVIDGGSLQAVGLSKIPPGAILTPNRKEFEKLFGAVPDEEYEMRIREKAGSSGWIIAGKGPSGMTVSDGRETYFVPAGKVPLTMGGTGDVLAGVTVGLLAKNPPLISVAAAGFLVQRAVDRLAEQAGSYFNADDLALEVGRVWFQLGAGIKTME